MPTIDLTTPPALPEGALEALPRRLTLTLPELRLLAEKAGGAPLPFDTGQPGGGQPAEPAPATNLESRLGQSKGAVDDQAHLAALAALNDPADSLARRGLLVDGTPDQGVAGALGLLATPELALDLDVALVHGPGQARALAWHRERGNAVATLATTDGLVFELAWFASAQWPGELARVAGLPDDLRLEPSGAAPELVDLPFEVLDAGAEALRTGRADLLDAIVAQHLADGHQSVADHASHADITDLVSALVGETRGRLRALVADVSAGGTTVGVVSWVLLADGWRQLRAHQVGDARLVEVRRVLPSELAASIGPVLAEVAA